MGWVHEHAANCGSLPSLQRTLSSEYCGIIQAVWGCDRGHDFTMDTDSSCRALFLDSALAVKWAWGKERSPRLAQNSELNPTGAASQLSQTGETQVGSETKTLPSVDVALLHSHGDSVGPGIGPYTQPNLAPSEAPGKQYLWLMLEQDSVSCPRLSSAESGRLYCLGIGQGIAEEAGRRRWGSSLSAFP